MDIPRKSIMAQFQQPTAPSPRQALNGQGVLRIPARKNNARTHPKVETNPKLGIGTWNVKSLYIAGKLDNLVKEMERCNLDIIGLSEIRWPDSGKCTKEKATLYYSGNNLPHHYNGVGFLVSKKTNKAVKNFVAYSDRTALLQVRAAPVDLNIIQIYAPTLDKPENEVDQLYKEIKELMGLVKKSEGLIIMGDFNAKVGQGRVEDVVGDFGLGDRNNRGDKLIQFCQEEKLVITNTWFKLPPRRLYTWQSPQHTKDHIIRNQIDFILINQRYRNGLHGVRTYPGTDIGSDHNPVVGKLKIKLKRIKRRSINKIDINNLRKPEVQIKVREKVNEAIAEITSLSQRPTNIEDTWNNFKSAIATVTKNEIGPPSSKKKKWMTDEILSLMDKRRSFKNKDEIKYQNINKEIRAETRKAKEQWLQDRCIEIEELEEKHDHFNIYKLVKEVTGRTKPCKLNNIIKDNKIITDPKELLHHWKSYTQQLYAENYQRNFTDEYESEPSPNIMKAEVLKAIKQSKQGKAAGTDDVYVEVVKLLNDENVDALVELFNNIYDQGEIPQDWLQSTFVPIPKIPNAKRCDQYRMISLLSHVSKLFLKIIHARIYNRCERDISPTQFGFRQGFGTREALFSLTVLLQKCRDQRKDVYMCFIDYQKAFDCVKHTELIRLLQERKIDKNDLRFIKNLYMNQTASVRVGSETTQSFPIEKGVRQGCVLSPLLFNLYSEAVFESALKDTEDGIKINGQVVNNLRYADDTVIIADSQEALQRLIDKINNEGERLGLKINSDKTKVMIISRTPAVNSNILVNGKNIQRVPKFKYLGSWITEDLDPDTEIRCRIEQARATFMNMRELLSNKSLDLMLRYRFVKCYIYSVLLYGVETWTIKANTMNRLEAFEMWVFRRMLKIPWTDHVTNAEVINRMGRERELLQLVKRRKAAYLGHIFRNTKYQFLKLIMEGKIEGRRGIGRKKYSWLKNIRDWTNLDAHALFRAAQDRNEYARIVANIH